MNKNDVVELEISSLTNEGNGVGRYEGMAVFFTILPLSVTLSAVKS